MVIGRHTPECLEEPEQEPKCHGCQRCPELVCMDCGREHAEQVCPPCRGAVREDLAAISKLWPKLPTEAIVGAPGGRRSAMASIPGGEAMVLLGPFTRTVPEGQDLEGGHPLQVLALWADAWRLWRGQAAGDEAGPATIESEVGYLERNLDAIAAAQVRGHEGPFPPDFRDLSGYVRGARRRLEDVVQAGERPERTHTPCLDCRARLEFVWAGRGDPATRDHYACPRCKRTYTHAEFAQAKAQLLHAKGAEKFILVGDAVVATGRSEFTLRSWVRDLKVTGSCDLKSRRLLVWWPDVRERHQATGRRKHAGTQA